MKRTSEALDDLAWPVTPADCTVMIAFSIAALVCIGAAAAWILAKIFSIA